MNAGNEDDVNDENRRNKEATNGFLEDSAPVSNTEPKWPAPLNLRNEGLKITLTPDVSKVKNTKKFVRKLQMGVDPDTGVRDFSRYIPAEENKMKATSQNTANTNCHQCKRNDKGRVVYCSKCPKKYCLICIRKWYPSRTEEEIAQVCPFCRGHCNCKACLRRYPEVRVPTLGAAEKVHFLRNVICSGLPVVSKIHLEQMLELEAEARIQSKPVEALDIPEANGEEENERHYCDNCNTSLVSFHRSCEVCKYDLCLSCCRELREGSQPGGDSGKRSVEDAEAENEEDAEQKEMTGQLESAPLPDLKVNSDLSIPCPRCCCAKKLLELKCTQSGSNWVANIEKKGQKVARNCQFPMELRDSHP